jgi:hypothetical protein
MPRATRGAHPPSRGRRPQSGADERGDAYLAEAGAKGAAPALARLTAALAERFGVLVTEKSAAELVPVLGAAGGATINLAFMDHFQNMAEGHFTVRALERKYGERIVQAAYEQPPG